MLVEALTVVAFLSGGIVALFADVLPKRWDATLRRTRLHKSYRAPGVVALSVTTALAVMWSPWLLMGVVDGRLTQNLTDPLVYYAMLVMFGPILAVQAWYAVRFVRHEAV